MATLPDKQLAHLMIDWLPDDQMSAAVTLLESLLPAAYSNGFIADGMEDEAVSEDEVQAVGPF